MRASPRGRATLPNKDAYEVLGLEPGATKTLIRHAYRRLAKRYHPDVNGGDDLAAERFKEVQCAYEALADERFQSTRRRTAPTHEFVMPDEHPFLRYFLRYRAFTEMRAGKETRPGTGEDSSESPP